MQLTWQEQSKLEMATTIDQIPIDVLWLILRKVILSQKPRCVLYNEHVRFYENPPAFTLVFPSGQDTGKIIVLISLVNRKWRTLLKDKLYSFCLLCQKRGRKIGHHANCEGFLFKKGSFS